MDTKQTLSQLTEKEKIVIQAAFEDSAGNGHDFGLTDNIQSHCDLSPHQVAGTLGHLENKGLLELSYYGDPELFFIDEDIREELRAWMAAQG